MSNQSSIYNEKKIAYYESTFKTGAFSKSQDVNLTLTAEHVYGLAYIMEQSGIIEGDPVYTRFTCSLGEITKVFTNENSKQPSLYIQCDNVAKGVLNRKRIVIPSLKNASEAADTIQEIKRQFDEKIEKSKERARAKEKTAPESIRVEVTPPQTEAAHGGSPSQPASDRLSAKDIKEMATDKMKDFDFGKLKKKAGNLIDNMPIPKNIFQGKKPSYDSSKNIPDEIASANAAAEAALSAFTAPVPARRQEEPKPAETEAVKSVSAVKEEPASEAVPVQQEETVPVKTETAAQPETTAAQPETAAEQLKAIVTDVSAPAEPERKPLPKVTVDDLLKLNNSLDLDLDMMTAAEPPITRMKKDASRYLDDIGGDYKPAEKHGDLTEVDGQTASSILLGDIGDAASVHYEEPAAPELESEISGDIVLSDMSGNAVDVSSEITPAEYMDYTHKTKKEPEKAAEETSEPETVQTESAVPVQEAEAAAETPVAIAAENAYIDDETTADAESISADRVTEEVPEVKNVHIDFSTEISQDTSLEDFENAVKKLKSMLDSNLITKEEFMAEKKKLLAAL